MMDEENKILPSSDGHHNRADMRMVMRAMRRGWDVPEELRKKCVAEMGRLAVKRTKVVETRDGTAEVDNDLIQVSAVKTLVEIDKMIQADDHLQEKYDRIDAGQATDRQEVAGTVDLSRLSVEELERLKAMREKAKIDNVLPAE